ncbi:NlpC/P60 family protein [Flagellimonas lutaonensis]|uniref:NLP/P60 protein n=1 Tax=Flagellimonas lutaonensis TaxID=516051 RepID=A0A0D5YVX7_9FLAO|nr:NlpC/P60 family protein [Allomuricauda lutaonensis]AKA36024.1 NLP/P60 protein [Allomuricauda lutaonensis]
MKYGICPLGVVSVRVDKQHEAPQSSQLLYGEIFKVLERHRHWSKIRMAHDAHEGWIENLQYHEISEDDHQLLTVQPEELTYDLVSHVSLKNHMLMPIVMGSRVDGCAFLGHVFEGHAKQSEKNLKGVVDSALHYLNAPFLHGGRTPFGIDAAGFVQMAYRTNGFDLKRDVEAQSLQGYPLSFIEESEPGDLAFFDNKDGVIDHVGIILPENHIIHVYGKVQIDRLDHTGIFNSETNRYTHSLRVIKKMA